MLWLAGCARYQPMPLSDDALRKASTSPSAESLRLEAQQIRHPILHPVELDLDSGLSPDSAGVLAVLLNPTLRADRNRRHLADAQLLQAGLLPNPQLTLNYGWVTGGVTTGAVSPYGFGLSWDITSLITHRAKQNAARAQATSVYLDVAWGEWQTAEAAKTAVYDQVALEAQLAQAREVDDRLAQNLKLTANAFARHERVLLDLAAAESASLDAHLVVLGIQQQIGRQRLVLPRAMGLSPETRLKLRPDLRLPSRLNLPSKEELLNGLEERRLDLLALRRGYDSQEEALRAAVLAQFPKIGLGYSHARDNTNVISDSLDVTADLPIFDRNQGGIATERATRQKLFDEYVSRLYAARFDIVTALDDIAAVTAQIAAAEAALPSLERLVETYRQSVERGNADVLSYYTAVGTLAQKRLSVLKLKQQLIEDRVSLEIASGRFLPDDDRVPATQPATRERISTQPATGTGPTMGVTRNLTTNPTTNPAANPATRPTTDPATILNPTTREAQP